ncbi:hypothetical protein SAMN04515656_13116 [Eubacterium aggregans]|uniref:Uncharacterized protein n=1 Tax=Eubacterium aggregans TaxID=81409 RepID=A0A1H4E326_9FIRM|nr:hypothetical protein [Eubacterium aggregans]SEA79217.1 hypothetical protein SAMN04515656_13116 [Eubacterium aggregans]
MKKSLVHRLKINVFICSIILLGFIAIGLFTTLSIRDSYTDSIRDISSLSSQAMYTDILYMLEQPINIASAMSKDTLLRDLMPRELEDGAFTDTVKAYLGEYQKPMASILFSWCPAKADGIITTPTASTGC